MNRRPVDQPETGTGPGPTSSWTESSDRAAITRRTHLKGITAIGSTAVAGCLFRNLFDDGDPTTEPVSLSIKTMPTDDDPYAIRIAQRLAENLRAVGVPTTVVPMRDDVLFQDVLVENDFDVYVGRHPGGSDPDFLFPFLHSQFEGERGWQNPFGFEDATVDDLLVRQRTAIGGERRRAVFDLQRSVVRAQPFTVVAHPDVLGTFHRRHVTGLSNRGLVAPPDYLAVRAGTETEDSPGDPSTLDVTYTNRWVTRNLNPLAAAYRDQATVTGLLYDPLVVQFDGESVPWLAASWRQSGDREVTVTLRDGLRWHDGRPLSAADVAFTYRFLADTALDAEERTIPAPRFRESTSLVDDVDALDDRRVRLRLATSNPDLAVRALTLPVLPAHEWESRAKPSDVAAVTGDVGTTEALEWKNMQPVGSGPLRFVRAVRDKRLVLERSDEHFLNTGTVDGVPESLAKGFGFDRLVVHVAPSDDTAVDLVAAEEAAVTGTSLAATTIPAIGRLGDLQLLVAPSDAFYHVGYNLRRKPLDDPQFRHLLARLLDKAHVVDTDFHRYASPAASPLGVGPWLPDDLAFVDDDPVAQFLGEDGRLDVARARREARRAGYDYGPDGQLIANRSG